MLSTVSKTSPNTRVYPLHFHDNYEIMLYIEGNGNLCTENRKYPFTKGTVIIVPPRVRHGSASENCFVNISVEGEFDRLLNFNKVISLCDNNDGDGKTLAELIFKNRNGDKEYLNSICTAYIHFLLQRYRQDAFTGNYIDDIIKEINEKAFSPEVNTTSIISKHGYAEDYIRAKFKKHTGKTPVEFLNGVRIDHAIFLMNVYNGTLPISEISAMCGFDDHAYFSRVFKKYTGVSPANYKKVIK